MLQLANIPLAPSALAKSAYELPPLILHPITQGNEAPPDPLSAGAGSLRIEARRVELRMLCCLGKDLARWLEQCLEFTRADPELAAVSEGQLIDLLVLNPPENVVRKMHAWGVKDFRAIFARALGLNAVFPHPPAREQINGAFAEDLARYADALYRARRQALPQSAPTAYTLQFQVYASGEYAQMLERAWGLCE